MDHQEEVERWWKGGLHIKKKKEWGEDEKAVN